MLPPLELSLPLLVLLLSLLLLELLELLLELLLGLLLLLELLLELLLRLLLSSLLRLLRLLSSPRLSLSRRCARVVVDGDSAVTQSSNKQGAMNVPLSLPEL